MMILWWTTLLAMFGSLGTILVSIPILAHIEDKTEPRAIFWFFVAAVATVVLYFAVKVENSPAMRSASWRPTKPVPVVQSPYWIVYHGTPTWNNAAGAITTGFIPGPEGRYGQAIYTSFDYEYAKSFAQGGGYIFKLYINIQTPFTYYSQVPGADWPEKREHCLRNRLELVYVEKDKFFISFGYHGVPVRMPGLEMVEVFDEYGNQITLQ